MAAQTGDIPSAGLRSVRWQLVLPAAMTVVLAFRAGGFFPGFAGLLAAVLVLGMVGRITIGARPFSGWSPALAVAAGALALLACWTLASALWSDAPGRAVVEFDRVLLYLFALVLAGSFATRAGDLATALRWLAAALGGVCLIALLTRMLPDALPTRSGLRTGRLSFPTTYWNTNGLLAALGLVLALHLSSARDEHPVTRVLGAAALPVLAVTLYFTFSRGAIAATVIGIVAYAVLAHPRGLPGALLASAPGVVLALRQAYGADLLASGDFASAAARPEAQRVLLVLAGATLLTAALRTFLLPVDRRLGRLHLPDRRRRLVLAAVLVAALLGVAAVAAAVDAPRRLGEQREAFEKGSSLSDQGDLRERLTQSGNNGRIDHWQVSRESFRAEPLKGTGAGTYRLDWELNRKTFFRVTDGHSLYFELAGELGFAGLLMLAVALLTPLAIAASRLLGPEAHAHGAFLAAAVLLLVHAGVDWDWEMPVLFAWFFATGGFVLAARESRGRLGALPRLGRLLAGLACLLVAVTPALVALSQDPLNRATEDLARNRCPAAIDGALDSIDRFGVRAEPYEILGYCDLRVGQPRLALQAMRAARARDPRNWEYAYGLAIAQALGGEDPRPAAREARRLNPLGALARELDRGLRGTDEDRWPAVAARADVPFE